MQLRSEAASSFVTSTPARGQSPPVQTVDMQPRRAPTEPVAQLPPSEPSALPPAQQSLQAQQNETTARLLGVQAPQPRPPSPRRANLRVFLDKLARRRKKVACTAKCRQTIEASIRQLGGKQLKATGRIPYAQLKEVLRTPPNSVPSSTLRDLVDVAKSYDSLGDGCVNLQELLDGSLEVGPGMVKRLRCMLPLLALLAWILIGPAVYCPVMSWSYLDGLYFSVMTLTTVGTSGGLAFGGLVYPKSTGLKLFTAFYLLAGVAVTTWLFVAVTISALLAHEARLWALLSPRDNEDLLSEDGLGARTEGPPLEDLAGTQPASLMHSSEFSCEASQRPRGSRFDEERGRDDASVSVSSKARKSQFKVQLERLRSWAAARAWKLSIAACSWTVFMIILVGTILALTTSSEASFVDALCWAVLTSFTVGYGDIEPAVGDDIDANLGRGLSVLFVLLAVSGVTGVLLKIGGLTLQVQTAKLEARIRARALPMDLLRELDANGGGVGRLEFLCAGLMASDRVSAHDLWLVLELFRRLDPTGTGLLQASQLQSLSRKDTEPLSTMELLSSIEVPSCPPGEAAIPARSFNFGSPSPSAVQPQFDLTAGSSLESGHGRPYRNEPLSYDQATPLQQLAPAEPVVVEKLVPVQEDRSAPFLQEIYQDYNAARRQLEAKDAELVAALKAQSASEQALGQALTQREALHKEVLLLTQIKHEHTEKLEQETTKRKEAEIMMQELKTRCFSLEGKLQDTQRERDEAERKLKNKAQLLGEVQDKNKHLERRAQDAEHESADYARRLQEQSQQLKLQADARVNEVRLQAAELDLHRQGEMQSALLELQALSAGQRALLSELHGRHTLQPLGLPDSGGKVPLRLSTGLQPWEVWERSSGGGWSRASALGSEPAAREPGLSLVRPHSTSSLLLANDKVRAQADFLDSEVKKFYDRSKA